MAEPLTLINAFEVPADEADRFIAAWEKARDYLATQPGYVDTALHQAVGPEAEFQFVNIARWRSAKSSALRQCATLTNWNAAPGVTAWCSAVST